MIIAMVQFKLKEPLGSEDAVALFHANSHLYEGRKDLKRKSYIRALDGSIAGAIYFWRSLEDAKVFYSEQWHAHVLKKYGVAPTINYFESPHVIDNE